VNEEKLRALGLDLTRTAPRSRALRSPTIQPWLRALVDKCRAELVGWNGGYHYNCPMDRKFFAACGLDADALREFIATGANDAEVAVWMSQNAASTQKKITDWTRRFLANPVWRLLDLEDWLHARSSSRKHSR
jgi:hypothetical protein